jgi:hypothetical protein
MSASVYVFDPHITSTSSKTASGGRLLDFGNVRLIGMTPDELRNAYMLPQDIIDNTIKAYSVNATGYGSGAPTGRYFAPGRSCGSTST